MALRGPSLPVVPHPILSSASVQASTNMGCRNLGALGDQLSPPLTEGAHGETQACVAPCDSKAPRKNHMSLLPDSLPPNLSHLDPLPPSQPEQAGLCPSTAVCAARGQASTLLPRATSTHTNVLARPVALLSPFHGGRPGQLQGDRGRGTQVKGLCLISVKTVSAQGTHPPRQHRGWGSLAPSWPAC